MPLSRFFDKVEVLIALNRRGQLAQKELSEKLDQISARLEENHALAGAAKVDAETQSESRAASASSTFSNCVSTARCAASMSVSPPSARRLRAPLRQVTVILGFLSGLAALMSFVSLAVLLWGG
ncbi:Membrane-anchored protein OS=Bosea thiooxidans OX=53254 GN=ARD30_00075 PE=4 SV=1 [Bosea thiooxidans]